MTDEQIDFLIKTLEQAESALKVLDAENKSLRCCGNCIFKACKNKRESGCCAIWEKSK